MKENLPCFISSSNSCTFPEIIVKIIVKDQRDIKECVETEVESCTGEEEWV